MLRTLFGFHVQKSEFSQGKLSFDVAFGCGRFKYILRRNLLVQNYGVNFRLDRSFKC